MPKLVDARPFKRRNNVDTLNWIRRNNSTAYAQRVPEATRANIENVMDSIFNYSPTRNEFINSMVNQIGLVIASSTTFTNPLKNYKRAQLSYGDTVEETFIGLAEAYVYDADRDYMERILFGRETPETQTVFHKVNREEFYKITVDINNLKRAFASEYGISDFVSRLMQVPASSDEWDEFTQMTSLFGEFYNRDGFFVRSVPDVSNSTSDAPDAKALLRQVRADADTLKFVSRHYNAAGMPVAVNADDLILFTTPEGQAAIDVEALSAAFNMDKANVYQRVEVIPREYFRIPGMQAILTTRDFFVVMDRLYETASQFNAATLAENHFLHHWEVMSISPFAPAILYSSTDAATVIPTEDDKPVSIDDLSVNILHPGTLEPVTEVERGKYYQVIASATTDPADGINDKVKLSLAWGGDPVPHSEYTRIEQTGTLLIGQNEQGTTLHVHATALEDDTITQSTMVTVTGDRWGYWPDKGDVPAVSGVQLREWKSDTAVKVGDFVSLTDGTTLQAGTAGTTGPEAPTVAAGETSVPDGTVEWKVVDPTPAPEAQSATVKSAATAKSEPTSGTAKTAPRKQ